MRRLPRNLHVVTTSRSPDNAIGTKHATRHDRHVWSAAHATQNDYGGLQSCPCRENCNSSSQSDAKVLRLPHKTGFDTLWIVGMSRSAKLRQVWNLQKSLLQNSPEARPYGPDADTRERLRNVERTHPQPPNPQSETGTLAMYSGKYCIICIYTYTHIYIHIYI